MASPQTSVLSLQGVSLAAPRGAASAVALDFELGHREVALIEIDDDGDAAGFLDLCLGLVQPRHGEVSCLGRTWSAQTYHEMLAHRGRIGTLVGTQAWPAHLPVAEVTLAPRLYHTEQPVDEAIAAATELARHFGLPGLPAGGPETVHLDDLVRAACVRAFLGAPELVLIADAAVDGMAQLGVALAQSIGAVQDRGGSVLWLVDALGAPAARFVSADHVLHLGDRGLGRARSGP
jgi:phospholipid/cholesterol/gamma-HCH transport system ATP-binding protein